MLVWMSFVSGGLAGFVPGCGFLSLTTLGPPSLAYFRKQVFQQRGLRNYFLDSVSALFF